MADTVGYIQCSERHCNEIAEVRQATGKRKSLYTVCPACGTNQGHGAARQTYLSENLKASREELNVPKNNSIVGYKSNTEEKAAIPSKQAPSSDSDDTETISKDKPQTPPVLWAVIALIATVLTTVFATRKPSKHKEQAA